MQSQPLTRRRASFYVCPHSCLLFLFLFFSLSLAITPTLGLFQDLMEQLEKQDRTIRKLKKQLKVYSKRIGEMGGT